MYLITCTVFSRFNSNKRHEYVKTLRYDILGLGELHNQHLEERYKGRTWICSDRSPLDEQGKDLDPAAGVSILLSPRMVDRLLDQDCVGSRIVYVRLAGPVCKLFVVIPCIPHKERKNAPYAQDTIKELKELLTTVCKTDCIILMGDFNCELQRNVQGCTGKWCVTQRKDNGNREEILTLMCQFDLFTVDTLFKPVKKNMGRR